MKQTIIAIIGSGLELSTTISELASKDPDTEIVILDSLSDFDKKDFSNPANEFLITRLKDIELFVPKTLSPKPYEKKTYIDPRKMRKGKR